MAATVTAGNKAVLTVELLIYGAHAAAVFLGAVLGVVFALGHSGRKAGLEAAERARKAKGRR